METSTYFTLSQFFRHSPTDRRRLPSSPVPCDEQGSPLLGRRRLSPQYSIESYYSIASEGDGDIFASVENLGRRPRLQRQSSFMIPDSNISAYSELNEDFHSSISDLFSKRLARLGTQGTFSEQGSLRSLSIDQEEIIFEVPGSRKEEEEEGQRRLLEQNLDFVEELPFDEGEGYISSSCSISMSSDIESSHLITVPVFIEPAPPEIRFLSEPGLNGDLESGDLGNLLRGDPPRFVRQETLHTDSGLDTEDICPASPTNSRFSADITGFESPCRVGVEDRVAEEDLRLVLVRDIGIQCCAESPNLNLNRKNRLAHENPNPKFLENDSLINEDKSCHSSIDKDNVLEKSRTCEPERTKPIETTCFSSEMF